jgi:hypothetical protein
MKAAPKDTVPKERESPRGQALAAIPRDHSLFDVGAGSPGAHVYAGCARAVFERGIFARLIFILAARTLVTLRD